MSSPLSPGHIVAGRYRVDMPIGEGGMGMVYLVRHVHTDEKLALKVLHAQALRDASAVERFRREARAPAQIASEHVARVTDADTAADLGGAPFYVMEYLQGKDLERLIKEEGALPPATVVEYLRQVARALDKAHGMGIVHRDLKPENLFLTEREDGSPCIKLLDFGIARLAGGDLPAHLKTQAGVMFGTPAFMSPEQMEGDLERIGPPTDIWSFGLIAFKLLCKEDFWTGNSVAVVCAQVLGIPMLTPTQRGSTLGPAFDAWFATCVSRDISARFKTAGEAVAALATALGVPLAAGRRSASMVDLPAIPAAPLSNPGGSSTTGTLAGVAPASPSAPGTSGPGGAPVPRAPSPSLPFDTTVAVVSADPPSPRLAEGTISPTAQGRAASEVAQEAPKARPSRAGAYLLVSTVVLVGAAIAGFFSLTGPGGGPGTSASGSPPPTESVGTAVAPADSAAAALASADAPPPPASAAASAAPSGSAPAATSAHLGGPRPSGWPAGTRPPDPPPSETAAPPPATTPPPPPTAPPPAASGKPSGTGPSTGGGKPSSSEQRARLASLQRLCDQGIYTPSECAAKRQAILQGSP